MVLTGCQIQNTGWNSWCEDPAGWTPFSGMIVSISGHCEMGMVYSSQMIGSG